MDAADRELLEATVRDAVTDVEPGVVVDAVLARLGWYDMLAAHPDDATAVVFHALGTGNATAGVLDDVLAAALGHEPRPDLAVLLPPYGGADRPGLVVDGRPTRGLATSRIGDASDVLVVGGDGTPASVVVPVAGAAVMPIDGIDPALGLRAVTVEPGAGVVPLADGAWDRAIAAGRRAVAHQIAGACRRMLELARAHAIERRQFGRPVARFQAVQHRLADTLVAVEALDAALVAAAVAPGPTTAALAKVVAGETAATTARHCQQVLAGTGFTTEHPFHRYYKRTMALAGLLGSSEQLTVELGHQLLSTRAVPTLLEL